MRKIILLLIATFPLAGLAESSFYVGGGVGTVDLESKFESTTAQVDGSDASLQAFAGYAPLENLVLELGWVDFGDSRDDAAGGSYIEIESWAVYLNAHYLFNPVDWFTDNNPVEWLTFDANLGIARGDGKTTLAVPLADFKQSISENDTGLMYGLAIGIRPQSWPVGMRLTWNNFDLNYEQATDGASDAFENADRFGLDVIFRF